MKFNIADNLTRVVSEPIVGNVYNVRGGSGAKHGYMMVIVSIEGTGCTTLTINKDGNIVSGSNYGLHYFEEKCPIAYCAGLENLSFDVNTI